MYTRCPSCSTTFRVTATVLQMADGEVRCGACGGVFNALHTLVDDWSGAGFTLPGAPRLIHPDAPLPDKPPAPGDSASADATETLEFDVPENEWQRYFIDGGTAVAEPQPEPESEPDAEGEPEPADRTLDQPQPFTARLLEEETADTDTWQEFLRESADEPEVEIEFGPDADEDDQPAFVIGEDAGDGAAEPDESPEEPPAATPETVLDWGPPPAFPERAPRRPAHTGWWLAAGLLAAVSLAAQAVHYDRDNLAAHPAYGAAVRELYGRLGAPLYPAWPLDAYEIRDTKAIAERSAPGALDIVAEIAVIGSRPVGLPLVRVVLRDRWSNAVASGVFDPAHYLAEPQAASGYAPGTLVPVEISVKDPGSAAQGYELDVCIPDRKHGLQCKATRDPFRR